MKKRDLLIGHASQNIKIFTVKKLYTRLIRSRNKNQTTEYTEEHREKMDFDSVIAFIQPQMDTD